MIDYKIIENVSNYQIESKESHYDLNQALKEGYEILQIIEVSTDVEKHSRTFNYNVLLRRTPASQALYGKG